MSRFKFFFLKGLFNISEWFSTVKDLQVPYS